MNPEFFDIFSKKYSDINFQENPSSGSRIVACGQTDGQTEKWTDMASPIFAFRNFANGPKNGTVSLFGSGNNTVRFFRNRYTNMHALSQLAYYKFCKNNRHMIVA